MRRVLLLLVMMASSGAALAQPRHTPDQVVMLHLERGGKHIRHTVPFHLPRTRSFRFCIPREERFLRYVEVLREDSPAVVLRIPRGAPCLVRTLAAGDYRLVVEHDGSQIPAGGKRAFIHVPRLKQGTLTATGAPTGFTCDPDNYNPDLYTFTAPDGTYVNGDGGPVVTGATPDDLAYPGGWAVCPDGLGTYTVSHGAFFTSTPSYFTAAGPTSTDRRIVAATSGPPARFKVADLGDRQFTLSVSFDGALYPVVLGGGGSLIWAADGNPTVFTIALITQLGGIDYPPLAVGEVGFFQGCDEGSFPRFVVPRDLPSLAPFTWLLDPVDDTFASLQTGPQTAAIVHADSGYGGAALTAGAAVACLTGALSGSVSSIEVLPDRQLVAATDTCQSCDLSGVDLSGLDLSGGQFQGSIFTGANLTGTNFQSASLDNSSFAGATTVLTNTSFLGAIVKGTSFAGADLSTATFQIPNVFKAIWATDFSSRLDLTDATINLTTFPLDDWRYMNLTHAQVSGGLSGVTLSTTSSPRDFSGAILDHLDLRGALLDGANLGCATSGAGALVCTRLSEASLTGASLKKAKLTSAVMQGAELSYANLDTANLCGARLNQTAAGKTTRLQGAYLRNVCLAFSDLTGASFANANFYTAFPAPNGSCAPQAGCVANTSCASAVSAAFSNASFEGAYLAGVDFTGASPQAADFSGAFLPGAIFGGANLSKDPANTRRTTFSGSYLQGATFPDANVTDASFLSSYVDLVSGAQLLMQLPPENLLFTGYQTPASGRHPGCARFTPGIPTSPPDTDTTNTCPDGGIGPCTNARWASPSTPLEPVPTTCTSTTYDPNFH